MSQYARIPSLAFLISSSACLRPSRCWTEHLNILAQHSHHASTNCLCCVSLSRYFTRLRCGTRVQHLFFRKGDGLFSSSTGRAHELEQYNINRIQLVTYTQSQSKRPGCQGAEWLPWVYTGRVPSTNICAQELTIQIFSPAQTPHLQSSQARNPS